MRISERTQAFLSQWRDAFQEVEPQPNGTGKAPESAFWEGGLAYRELERAGLLRWARFEDQETGRPYPEGGDWRFTDKINEVMAAVAKYERFSGKIVQTNAEFLRAERFADAVLKRFRKYATKAREGDVRRFWTESGKKLLLDFAELQRQRKTHQEAEWSKKYGFWGRELLDHGYKRRVPVSERDLDTILQISLAKIFRVYLRKEFGIGLETIARLIVLVYMSAGLVEITPDCLLIKNTGKELKVVDVRQRLHRAKVR